MSEANKPSAGASWPRPDNGRPTSASISNFLVILFKIVEGNVFDGQSSYFMARKYLSGHYGNIAHF